jgi:hypothetical protein
MVEIDMFVSLLVNSINLDNSYVLKDKNNA